MKEETRFEKWERLYGPQKIVVEQGACEFLDLTDFQIWKSKIKFEIKYQIYLFLKKINRILNNLNNKVRKAQKGKNNE